MPRRSPGLKTRFDKPKTGTAPKKTSALKSKKIEKPSKIVQLEAQLSGLRKELPKAYQQAIKNSKSQLALLKKSLDKSQALCKSHKNALTELKKGTASPAQLRRRDKLALQLDSARQKTAVLSQELDDLKQIDRRLRQEAQTSVERERALKQIETEHAAGEAHKRRGRPKKSETPSIQAPPKKRGRPLKNAETTVSADAPKKRGRPAKKLAAVSSSDAPKKRGRPAKTKPEPKAPQARAAKRGRPAKSTSTTPSPVKRGRPAKSEPKSELKPKKRGRPKKELSTTDAPSSRSPGRPAKASSAPVVDAQAVASPREGAKKRGRPAKHNATAESREAKAPHSSLANKARTAEPVAALGIETAVDRQTPDPLEAFDDAKL